MSSDLLTHNESAATRVQILFRAVRDGDATAQPTDDIAVARQLLTELSAVRQQLADPATTTVDELHEQETSLLERLASFPDVATAGQPVQVGRCQLCPACTACLITPGVPDFEFVGAFLLIS